MNNLHKAFSACLVLLSFLALAVAAEAGLVAGYAFNDSLDDETTNYDGTVYEGLPTYSVDIPPSGGGIKSLSLNGVSSVKIPINPCVFSGDTDFSIVAWFKTDVSTGNCIISSGPGGQAEASHSMAVFMNPESDGAITYDNFWVSAASTTTDGLNDGAWHHYAISYTASTNTFNTYINGDLDDAGNDFYPDFPCSDPCISTLIGDSLNTTFPVEHGEDHWDGLLDDVGIYDLAISEGHVEDIMSEGLIDIASANVYVDAGASFGGDGESWLTAYKYLQDALTEAISGDTIYVAEGTYKPDEFDDPNYVPGDRTDTFRLISGLPIYGGFPSGGSSLSERDPNRYKTILSGDLAGNDGPDFANNDENSYHVVTGSGTNSTAILDGFTVTAGRAYDVPMPKDRGGGMYNESGNPTLTNCTFSLNVAYRGGGIYNKESNPTCTNCTFNGNVASDGAGMHNNQSSPTVTNCTFSGNSAVDEGGGVYNYFSSNPTVTNCTFSENSSTYGAGMMNATNSSPTVTNCTFSGNFAGNHGGGMANWSFCNPNLTDCTFSGNEAGNIGGGMNNAGSCSPTLTNCTFNGNSTLQSGGGMFNYDNSSPTLTNCTFSGNMADDDGGGLYNDLSSPELVNCIFSGNIAAGDGGGMYNIGSGPELVNCVFSGNLVANNGGGMHNGGITTLDNCIFWGNSDGTTTETAQIWNDGTLTIDYSCVQGWTGGFGGTGNIGTDPCFVDADGPDDTAGTEDDNLRLGSGSACIDAGDNTAVPADTADLDGDGDTGEPTPNDLDGNPRFINDVDVANTGNGIGPIVDMGAYEAQTLTAYVDDDAPGDPWPQDPNDSDPAEDGSEDHPFDAIQEAVDVVAIGGTVIVLEGTYTGQGNRDIDFEGKAFTLTSTDPEEPNVVAATIIDPNGTEGNPHRGFYFHSAEDANSVLTGFTITNGYGSSGEGEWSPTSSGGGVYCNSSSPAITNCTFSANTAGIGAGIYCYLSSPTVTGCKFIGNSVEDGGGMFNDSSSPTVTNCIFSGNSAGQLGAGAGMSNLSSNPTVTNCIFSGNWGGDDSGAMWNGGSSSPIITNCTFSGNSSDNHGGAMANWEGSSPTLTNCIFTGNTTPNYGGAFCNGVNGQGGNAILTNCIFSGNSAGQLGGAIYNGGGGMPTLTNCTFSGNTAGEAGGGIYYENSRVFIAQSVSEFSDTQEQDNWQYGYYDGDDPCSPWNNDDFEKLPDWSGEQWEIDGYWTSLWDDGGHPHKSPEHWAVRRWVSEVDGQVRIAGDLAKIDTGGGDGIVGHIIVDDVEEWSQLIEYNDADGVGYGINVDVSIGSLVDFTIDPNYTDWNDGSLFTAYIAERPPTSYVEIKNCILWGNTAPQGPQVGLENSDVQFTYCDVQGGQAAIYEANSVIDWGDGNIDADPNFVRNPNGDGSAGNPFKINTPAQMNEIGQHPENWGSYFILTADIDLSAYTGTQFNIIGNIGTPFTGSFDGNGHTISNFTYTTTGTNYIGLFGYVGTGGEIKNLGMTNVDVNAGTGNDAGALVGRNYYGNVTNCYATGSVLGTYNVGGLVGINFGTVSKCYATGGVSGQEGVGGLVGTNIATVSNCYAIVTVSGDYAVGGLVGWQEGTVSYCYAAGGVSGIGNVGGLVGYHYSGIYTSCFWDSTVNSGLTGVGNIADPAEVMGRTTAQMQTQSTFTDYGWDFVGETTNGTEDIWELEGVNYPWLAWESYLPLDNDDYGDLHLLGHSPCIDTGDPCSDYSNEPQPNGNRINMGAYGNTDEATVSTLDFDEDGLANPWEIFLGLDPDDDDMDDDGLLDGFEVCYDGDCYTYNPYDPATGLGGDLNAESDDTDEDMMTDAWEVLYSDVMGPINESDADDDPDGDRYMNFEEFIRGTAPNDPNSKPVPKTFYVDDISDPCEDGSIEHPFDAIQEAMDIAISWDTVIVLTGTYTGSGNRDIDFDRRRITLTSTDPENASVVAATIIDCQGSPGDPHRGFYFHGSEDANSVLTGFTITNGYQVLGGGIRCESSSPTVTNCTFSGNSAGDKGGGMYNYDSSPILINCSFSDNSSVSDGGGMRNHTNSNPTLTGCSFSRNSTEDDGGGMANRESSPTLIDCTFTANSAADHAGGVYNIVSSSPNLVNCTFSFNSAVRNAGGMNYQSPDPISPTVTNCTFTGNSAEYGGGMSISGLCNPTLTNCTFIGNSADNGGGMSNRNNSSPTVINCILWANIARTGTQIHNDGTSVATVSYSDVQGGWLGLGNIDKDPNLTPNPHLRAGSPCIDAGDPAFVVDPCAPYDIDGENRIINGRVDIGADEFLDTDTDGLPDFWESLHFESATGASFSADPDNDGLTNLQEYELFSSDPNTEPIYVDVDTLSDPCDQDGSSDDPFDTIQEGLDAADDGDTVLVADGTYTGAGNKELDFAGKSIVLRAQTELGVITINCGGSGRAFNFDDGETSGAAVIGFRVTNGQADYGGAIRCDHSHPQFRDCIITANTASVRGGGIYSTYSTLTFADCSIGSNEPNGVWAEYSGAKIFGDVKLDGNDWIGNNLMFTGDGTIKLYSGAKMDLADSEIRCNIAGMYDIIVDVGEELIVGGEAIIDLATLDPAKSNPNYGTLDCKGKLKVKGKAKIIHANIFVTQASVEDEAELSSNYISVNSWAPYGQFFVDTKAKVYDNEIHTDGDRIMNLKPAGFAGLIADNEMYIIITEGADNTRGGLMECRGADGWANSTCYDPNIFFCQVQPGGIPPFDPNTWTLKGLELLPYAKVNMTNLFDFQKPYDEGGADEVLYVKHLVLGEGAVLNTAYNRIYYENLDGDPNCFKNEPLLGFSLINIALDDDIEFLVRVAHNNYVHPTDPNFNLIYVERIEGLDPDPAGMMRMKNIGSIDARAKGLFAKATGDDVLVRFEYLFETDLDAQLVIYLSDVPELLSHNDPAREDHYLEVGRVYNPLDGQPGSAGSDRFGVYQEYVSPGNLDFIRGTRIEFELVGPDGTSVLINNWDPQVHCSGVYCKDVTGDDGVTVVDFLTVIGEYGESAELLPDGTSSVCLDGIFSDDGYVDSGDVISWDWTLNSLDRKNLCNMHITLTGDPAKAGCPSCPPDKSAARGPLPSTGPVDLEGFEGAFLVAGKMYDPCESDSYLRFMSDGLYGYDEQTGFIDRFAPVYERTNGRLVQDHDGVLYQLNLEQGLVRLDNAEVVIPKGELSIAAPDEPRYGIAVDVYVGLQGVPDNWSGRPIADAAFDADGFVYVVPVVVAPIGEDPNLAYTAAAKLQLLPGESPPYDVVKLYDDPNAASPRDNRHLNWLREIETDSDGYVYVTNAHSINESDILWVYDADTGQMEARLEFSGDPNDSTYLPAPIGMHVSDTTGKLYLASSQNSAGSDSTSVYAMSKEDLIQSQGAPNIQTIKINGMGHITDMTDDPATGTLWVVGFRMEDIPWQSPLTTKPSFYHPYIARIPYGSTDPVDANCLSDSVPGPENDLSLPLSIVWTGTVKCGGVDFDGSGEVNLADLAIFIAHWLDSGCVFHAWCEGTDLDPAFLDRGDVNVTDFSIFTQYWLDTCTYPE